MNKIRIRIKYEEKNKKKQNMKLINKNGEKYESY